MTRDNFCFRVSYTELYNPYFHRLAGGRAVHEDEQPVEATKPSSILRLLRDL